MAKMLEEKVTITISRLIKDSDSEMDIVLIDDDFCASIETVTQELLGGSHILVEVK